MSQLQSYYAQLEILDLRHFSAAQLRPLLRDEAERWQRRLHWDYTRASTMLLDYLDSRILPGFVALQAGHIVGYAFCVCEGAKAVIGDVYAFGETESTVNPICDTLLHHLLELVQATPGVDRVESQLLMFPDGALNDPFEAAGFASFPRCFMLRDLETHPSSTEMDLAAMHPGRRLILQSWQPEFYEGAAKLIHRCYADHMDAGINDQYRTLHGAQRFLHNIIRFPGCGVFDPESSWVLRDADAPAQTSGGPEGARCSAVEAVLLCSRVRADVNHITQICIAPSLRGQGLGQMMLEHCAREGVKRGVRQLSLTVTEANLPARRLYERNRFNTLHRFEAMVRDTTPTT
ncbi:MAG: GNAT family N-acetyltransferase [Acidobacteriaceae bacterium]